MGGLKEAGKEKEIRKGEEKGETQKRKTNKKNKEGK